MIKPITFVIRKNQSESLSLDQLNRRANEKLDNQYEEYRLSCNLSKEGIAPKLVGFATASIVTSRRKLTKFYTFMENYVGTVHDLLMSPRFRHSGNIKYRRIVETLEDQLIIMFEKLSKLNIICGDLKPENSVYRFRFNGKSEEHDILEVKLIDWGLDFCLTDHTGEKDQKLRAVSMMILYSLATQSDIIKAYTPPLFKDKLYTILEKESNRYTISTFLLETVLSDGRTLAEMAHHYYGVEDRLFVEPPSYDEWSDNEDALFGNSHEKAKSQKEIYIQNMSGVLTRLYIN